MTAGCSCRFYEVAPILGTIASGGTGVVPGPTGPNLGVAWIELSGRARLISSGLRSLARERARANRRGSFGPLFVGLQRSDVGSCGEASSATSGCGVSGSRRGRIRSDQVKRRDGRVDLGTSPERDAVSSRSCRGGGRSAVAARLLGLVRPTPGSVLRVLCAARRAGPVPRDSTRSESIWRHGGKRLGSGTT